MKKYINYIEDEITNEIIRRFFHDVLIELEIAQGGGIRINGTRYSRKEIIVDLGNKEGKISLSDLFKKLKIDYVIPNKDSELKQRLMLSIILGEYYNNSSDIEEYDESINALLEKVRALIHNIL